MLLDVYEALRKRAAHPGKYAESSCDSLPPYPTRAGHLSQQKMTSFNGGLSCKVPQIIS